MEPKDYLTIVSLIIAGISLYIGLINSKKTTFINSVTASRIKWIDTIRTNVSEFCGLTYNYSLTKNRLEYIEKNNLLERVDKLRFLIKLQLNPEDTYDVQIIESIDKIIDLTDSDINKLKNEINNLIVLTQNLLKLEWEGVKAEAKKGDLSKSEKKKLYEKHLKIEKI